MKLVTVLILMPLAFGGCASSLIRVKPSEAKLSRDEKLQLVSILKSDDENQLRAFIKDHSKAIDVPVGLKSDVIRGFVLGEAYMNLLQRPATIVAGEEGVFAVWGGGYKQIADSLAYYVTTPMRDAISCLHEERPVQQCLSGNLMPAPFNDVAKIAPLCARPEKCLYKKSQDGRLELSAEDSTSLGGYFPSFVPDSMKSEFLSAVRAGIKIENEKSQKSATEKEADAEADALNKTYHKKNCNFFIEVRVVQKLDAGTYELQVGCFPGLPGQHCLYGPISNARSENDIASVIYMPLKKNSLRPGGATYLDVMKAGQKRMLLKNGFDALVDIFKESSECGDLREKAQNLRRGR